MNISVIIPYFNSGDFIVEAVDSVLQQTYPPREIIIVDDGSDAPHQQQLRQFKDPIQIIRLDKNQGISAARNIGAQHATGEWLAFLDADDLWMPDKLANQKEFLENHPGVNICHTGVEVFCGSEVVAEHTDKPEWLTMKDALMIAQALPSSMLIKKSVFESVGMFDTGIPTSTDRELAIRLLLANEKIGGINQNLTRLRRENHGNISSQWKPKLIGHLCILKKHYKLFRQHKLVAPYTKWTFEHASRYSTGITRAFFVCLARLIWSK